MFPVRVCLSREVGERPVRLDDFLFERSTAFADLQRVAASILKALLVEMEYKVLCSESEKPHKDRKWARPAWFRSKVLLPAGSECTKC